MSTVIAGCELLLLGGLGQLLLTTPFLSRLIITSPLIFLTGILLGYLSAIAGWGQENPYWLLNILGTFLILLSGTIIPVEKYPPFLKYLAEIFPLNAIINEVLAVSYLDLSSIASFFFLILLAIIWTKLKVRYLIHH
ncbi:hypothetical protein [Ligilactobacillus equi]|uniref:hypothetical protein n=1 Tax=Ligilactobacillus equi TaxID=137357 RepID=UPI003B503C0A